MSFFSKSIFNFRKGEAFQYKADMRDLCIIPSGVKAESMSSEDKANAKTFKMKALYHFDLPKFEAIMWDDDKKERKTWKLVYFVDEGGTLCCLSMKGVSVTSFERFVIELKKKGEDWYKYQVNVSFSEKMISKKNNKPYYSLKFELGEKNEDEFSKKYIDYVLSLGEDFYLQTYCKPIVLELMQSNGKALGEVLSIVTGVNFEQKALPEIHNLEIK